MLQLGRCLEIRSKEELNQLAGCVISAISRDMRREALRMDQTEIDPDVIDFLTQDPHYLKDGTLAIKSAALTDLLNSADLQVARTKFSTYFRSFPRLKREDLRPEDAARVSGKNTFYAKHIALEIVRLMQANGDIRPDYQTPHKHNVRIREERIPRHSKLAPLEDLVTAEPRVEDELVAEQVIRTFISQKGFDFSSSQIDLVVLHLQSHLIRDYRGAYYVSVQHVHEHVVNWRTNDLFDKSFENWKSKVHFDKERELFDALPLVAALSYIYEASVTEGIRLRRFSSRS